MNNISDIVASKMCTGCCSCEAVCPVKCISIIKDDEGFQVPYVEKGSCIDCGRCRQSCHVAASPDRHFVGSTESMLFASDDSSLYSRATSGGAFGAIARAALREGHAVYGAAFDRNFDVEHILVTSDAEIGRLQGSKYVQSDTLGLFPEIKERLQGNDQVLFSGTPCQVAALRSYLGERYESLKTVEMVCHGVPSPLFWEKEVEYLLDSSVHQISFRGKIGYDRYGYALIASNGENDVIVPWHDDVYYKLFMENASLRECCYSCQYACPERVADITLGDCSRMDEYRELDCKEIATAVYINTEAGRELAEKALCDGVHVRLDLREELKSNRQLTAPASRPKERDEVYVDLNNMPFNEFESKYMGRPHFGTRIKRKLKTHVGWKTKLRLSRCANRLKFKRE